MKKRIVVYAASLDPITYGHMNVIERMVPLYDEVVVLVAVDSRKTYTFTKEERVAMAVHATAHLSNVRVDVCVGEYVVKKAASLGAQAIVRGLRNFKDLEDEQTLAEENRMICPEIETIWVPCLPYLMHVSSSMVKSHIGVDPSWEEQVSRSVPHNVVIELKKKYMIGKARKHWFSLMSLLGNPENSESVFQDLVLKYTEPHRAYHNIEHIVSMLDELGEITPPMIAVALAIWFHDAIYDSKRNDNEELSAVLAKEMIKKLGLSDSLGEETSILIITTKHIAQPDTCNKKLLIDLDLMILGKPEKEFDEYEYGIGEEYSWVPVADFKRRRAHILQSFLDRPHIFSTKLFREKYESSARNNLKRSIERLNT